MYMFFVYLNDCLWIFHCYHTKIALKSLNILNGIIGFIGFIGFVKDQQIDQVVIPS